MADMGCTPFLQVGICSMAIASTFPPYRRRKAPLISEPKLHVRVDHAMAHRS
jgi:hypothetical protein